MILDMSRDGLRVPDSSEVAQIPSTMKIMAFASLKAGHSGSSTWRFVNIQRKVVLRWMLGGNFDSQMPDFAAVRATFAQRRREQSVAVSSKGKESGQPVEVVRDEGRTGNCIRLVALGGWG